MAGSVTAPLRRGLRKNDNDAHGRFGPGSLDIRIRALGHCAVCAIPRRLRYHSAAKFSGPSLERLVETMRAWVRGLHLDRASFAKRFFNSTETDPVAEQLRSAALMAAFARTNADLRDGTEHLAAAMQRVGLDRWPRIFADARERALVAAPPPLDPSRPFIIGERFERAMARVFHTLPQPGTLGAPAPALPPGRYEPGLDNLVRRIAGAEPGDLPQLYADVTALYMQPGAHRAGETLIRAARDAADAGSDQRARQEILNDIAPIARHDPRQLAAGEFGMPGLGLLGGAAGLVADATGAASGAKAIIEAAKTTQAGGVVAHGTEVAADTEKAIQAASETGQAIASYPSLPQNPDDLLAPGYTETSNSSAVAAGHRTFENPRTGEVVRFDKGRPGQPGFEGQDHYHRLNPNRTSKLDEYLDHNGTPVARGSFLSHLLPRSP